MKTFLESPESQSILKSKYNGINSLAIISELNFLWAKFYSKLASSYANKIVPLFDEFLNEWSFDKKYPLLSKSFIFSLPDKDIKDSIENDLFGQLTSLGYDKNLCENALNISSQNVNDSILLLNGSLKASKLKINNDLFGSLISMGFDKIACEEALQLANNDINIAITLLIREAETGEKPNVNEDNDLINQLASIGFDRKLCKQALINTNNDFDDALNWLLNEEKSSQVQLEINSDAFGDLKPIYEQLTIDEKMAISRLLNIGSSPYEVLQTFLICQKDEKATRECLS